MKTPLAPLAVAAALVAIAPEANAQGFRPGRGASPYVLTAPAGPVTIAPAMTTAVAGPAAPAVVAGPAVPAYSYYVAPYPYPARGYVGLGNDFPFYGRPYGHPYDPWSWSYLSSYPNPGLARYFYPPVR
jgi:hypothetical protein